MSDFLLTIILKGLSAITRPLRFVRPALVKKCCLYKFSLNGTAERISVGMIFLLAGLSACMPIVQNADENQTSLSYPIDAQALKLKNLLSFDVYVEGSTQHALFAAETETPKKPFIGYIKSADAGRHWSQPIEIGHYSPNNMESAAGNEVQIAGAGNALLAIWQVSGELPGMGPLQSMYSLDGGQTWQIGKNPTGSEIDQSHPELLADQDGRFHLVWLDDRDENGYQGIRYARTQDAGQHWALAQTVDDSTCSCCWNRLMLGPDGQLNALYRNMEPRDMALAQSGDVGASWHKASTVGEFNWVFDGCPHNGGALAQSNQTLHSLVWTGAENKAGLYYSRSADNGQTWSAPQAMGNGSLAFHSDIAALDDAHVMAIWDVRGAEGSTVMSSKSLDNGGQWSTAQPISTPGSSASFPRIVATPDGFLAMWLEQKSGEPKRWVSKLFK